MNGTFFCNKCGAQNAAGSQFCSRCGATTAPGSGSFPASPNSPNFAPSYSAPVAPYTVVAPVAGVHYGGFWIRVVAAIVDFIIIRVILFPFKAIFGIGSFAMNGFNPDFHHNPMGLLFVAFGGGVLAVLALFSHWLYEALMESSSYQATLGKMIFGMKVTNLNGNRISFARATGRYFAKWLSAFILGIGYIMVGFTERKQGLHDLLAGTLVRRS